MKISFIIVPAKRYLDTIAFTIVRKIKLRRKLAALYSQAGVDGQIIGCRAFSYSQ